MGGGGVGHGIAAGLGVAVLFAIAGSLVAQVYLLGLCLVYLRVTEGLDLSATEAALRQKLEEARSRAGDLGEKARAAANRATAPSPPAATQPPPYDPPAPVQPPSYPAGMAAGAAFAAAPPPPPPAYAPPAYAPPTYVPPSQPLAPTASTDIDLSFDDVPPPTTVPPSPAPPAYSPPAYVAPPAAAPAAPAASTCPQCLSAVTSDDVFCGVCGYRLK